MSKIQIQTEIEIQKLLSQLKTSQLEAFLPEISAMIRRRKSKDKKVLEGKLLQQLNEECVLSEEHWKTFKQLNQQKEEGRISAQGLEQLSKLIKEEEVLRLKRVQLLGELAELKGSTYQRTRGSGLNQYSPLLGSLIINVSQVINYQFQPPPFCVLYQ